MLQSQVFSTFSNSYRTHMLYMPHAFHGSAWIVVLTVLPKTIWYLKCATKWFVKHRSSFSSRAHCQLSRSTLLHRSDIPKYVPHYGLARLRGVIRNLHQSLYGVYTNGKHQSLHSSVQRPDLERSQEACQKEAIMDRKHYYYRKQLAIVLKRPEYPCLVFLDLSYNPVYLPFELAHILPRINIQVNAFWEKICWIKGVHRRMKEGKLVSISVFGRTHTLRTLPMHVFGNVYHRRPVLTFL